MPFQDLKSDITEIRQIINESVNPCKQNGNDPRYKVLNNICYKFVDEEKSYENAKSYCENDGVATGRLFEPRSKASNDLVSDEAISFFGSLGYTYIGVNDMDNEGVYVYSSNGENVTFAFDWGKNNSVKDSEDCIAFADNNCKQGWCDRQCTEENRFVCEFF